MKATAVRLVLACAVMAMVGGLFGGSDALAVQTSLSDVRLSITAVCSDGHLGRHGQERRPRGRARQGVPPRRQGGNR
jgi:hypothetical protein